MWVTVTYVQARISWDCHSLVGGLHTSIAMPPLARDLWVPFLASWP